MAQQISLTIEHLQLSRQLILDIFPAQKLRLTSLIREKRNQKIIFGSGLSETNNEPTFRIHQKIDKKIKKKNSKIIFGSEFSETNNGSTFG